MDEQKIRDVLVTSIGKESDICILLSQQDACDEVASGVQTAFESIVYSSGIEVDATSVNFFVTLEDEAQAAECVDCLLGICTQHRAKLRSLTVTGGDLEPIEFDVRGLREAA